MGFLFVKGEWIKIKEGAPSFQDAKGVIVYRRQPLYDSTSNTYDVKIGDEIVTDIPEDWISKT
jgi:hypothetical protein